MVGAPVFGAHGSHGLAGAQDVAQGFPYETAVAGGGQVWFAGPPRHRQSMNRHPVATLSSDAKTVKISSLFIP
jgi:hypothetical protein